MTNKISSLFKYVLYTLFIVGWIGVIFNLGKNNLSNENFWLDESGQFWMAKGLYHFSPPLSEEGDLGDVIKQNSEHNLDPGGFTVILHYWTKISNSAFWLRMLPYSFFILSMIALALITYHFSNSVGLSIISLYYLPIIKGSLLNFSFELRAFSMEYFGIAISLFLFLNFIKSKTNKNLLILTSVMAIFSTSRYSFIVFALIIALLSFILQRRRLEKIKYYIPLALSLVLIYFLSYHIQLNAFISSRHADTSMFKYLTGPEVMSIIIINLTSTKSLYSTFLMAFGLVVFFFSNILKESKILLVSLIYLTYNGALCILSVLGLYPWYVATRWNLSMQMLNTIALFIVTAFIFTKIKDKKQNLEKYLPIYLFLFIIIFGKFSYKYVKSLGHYFRLSGDSISANFHALNIQPNNVFYVSEDEIPTWRYLNEYGSLKNTYYPKNTIFGKTDKESHPLVNYVITDCSIKDADCLDKQEQAEFSELTVYGPSSIYVNLQK